jgi:hypothetical protein
MDLLMIGRVNARNMYRSLINVLYVNKQEFSASSWRSNHGYTKMHGQPSIKMWNYLLALSLLSFDVNVGKYSKKMET